MAHTNHINYQVHFNRRYEDEHQWMRFVMVEAVVVSQELCLPLLMLDTSNILTRYAVSRSDLLLI